ncbi:unnamed protein product [Prunus armeniaca]|uniref:Uncharacterized protein n=1 Tax=Prunus armeniaca TaxID=36596 RepID=A0A6J5YA29_PRUAR|nr:unnamed protein product [Prunus armeniaca]CAB4321277.1 unnamed protein product [Prunus armeniaca]
MGSGNSRNRVGLSKSPSSDVPVRKEYSSLSYIPNIGKGKKTRKIGEKEIGLSLIFDGYECHEIPAYLQSHLFNNIITEPDFLVDITSAVRGGYLPSKLLS